MLHDVIKKFATFVLIENVSYVKILKDEKGRPDRFYIIRVTYKYPCVIVWLAFPGIVQCRRSSLMTLIHVT